MGNASVVDLWQRFQTQMEIGDPPLTSRKVGKTSQGFIVWLNLQPGPPPPPTPPSLSLVYPSASLNLPATVADPH